MQNEKLIIDKQNYYQLPNGNQVADITNYLDFNLGSAIKYIYRAGKKGRSKWRIIRFFEKIYYSLFKRKSKQVEDLQKAYTFLNYALDSKINQSSFWVLLNSITDKQIREYLLNQFQNNFSSLSDSFEDDKLNIVAMELHCFLLDKNSNKGFLKSAVLHLLKYIESIEKKR